MWCWLRADNMLDDVLDPIHIGLLLLFVFLNLLHHLLVFRFVDLKFPSEFLLLCPFLRGLFFKLYLFLELFVTVALDSSFDWCRYLWFSVNLHVTKYVLYRLSFFLYFHWCGHLLFWGFGGCWLFDLGGFLGLGYWLDENDRWLLRIGDFWRWREERHYEAFEVEEGSVDDSEGKICKNCEKEEVKHNLE